MLPPARPSFTVKPRSTASQDPLPQAHDSLVSGPTGTSRQGSRLGPGRTKAPASTGCLPSGAALEEANVGLDESVGFRGARVVAVLARVADSRGQARGLVARG